MPTKKKKIYLHIGGPKTGSTSIQAYLSENSEFLATQGIFIPPTQPGLPWHHALPISLIKELTDHRYLGWPNFEVTSDVAWEWVLSRVKSSECETAVISSECFCEILNENCRHALEEIGHRIRHYLKDFDVQIIAYIRPIHEYIDSIYKEFVKLTPTDASYAEIIEKFINNNSEHLHPSLYINFFSKIFGEKSIKLKIYEKSILLNENAIDDFLHTIGLKQPFTNTKEQKFIKNRSIPNELIDIKRAFNTAGISDHEINREISELLIQTGETIRKKEASKTTINQLLKDIQKEHEEIKQIYGINLNPPPNHINQNTASLSIIDSFNFSLAAYSLKKISKIEQKIDKITASQFDTLIKPYVGSKSKAVIYPAGAHTGWLMENTTLSLCNIIALADQSTRLNKTVLFGVPVIYPEEISQLNPDVVFIASPKFRNDIFKTLTKNPQKDTDIVILC